MGVEKLNVIRLIGRCAGCGRSNHPIFVFSELNVKYDLIGVAGEFKCPHCGMAGQYRSGRLAPTNVNHVEEIKDYTQELIDVKILFLEVRVNDLILKARDIRRVVDDLNHVAYKSPMEKTT